MHAEKQDSKRFAVLLRKANVHTNPKLSNLLGDEPRPKKMASLLEQKLTEPVPEKEDSSVNPIDEV